MNAKHAFKPVVADSSLEARVALSTITPSFVIKGQPTKTLPVGGDVYDRSTKCIAFEGRIVIVGFTSGRIPQAATNHVLVKNYSVVGLHWGLYVRRAPERIPVAARALLDLYQAGKIKPYISARVPLSEAPSALTMVSTGKSTGKVILTT